MKKMWVIITKRKYIAKGTASGTSNWWENCVCIKIVCKKRMHYKLRGISRIYDGKQIDFFLVLNVILKEGSFPF